MGARDGIHVGDGRDAAPRRRPGSSLSSPPAASTAATTCPPAGVARPKASPLWASYAGAEDGRLRFVDDLADSIAWGDARYRDFSSVGGAVVHGARARGSGPARPVTVRGGRIAGPRPTVARHHHLLGGIPARLLLGPRGRWVRSRWASRTQVDGASTAVPGLFFVGVHFLRTRKSSLLTAASA